MSFRILVKLFLYNCGNFSNLELKHEEHSSSMKHFPGAAIKGSVKEAV